MTTEKKRGVIKSRVMKLIKDLESGEHAQGRYCLAMRKSQRGQFSFCCLGRACEVAKANGCDVKVDLYETKQGRRYDGEVAVLPPSVQQWYGFDSDDPELAGRKASYYNDSGSTFAEIAKLFREELKLGTP